VGAVAVEEIAASRTVRAKSGADLHRHGLLVARLDLDLLACRLDLVTIALALPPYIVPKG
jgi:hypothetical protein